MTEIDGYVLYGGKGEGRSNPRPRKGGLSLTAATSKPPGAATSTAICKSRVHDLRSPWIGSSFCLFLLWAELFEVAGFAPWALPSQTRGRWAEPRSNLDPSSIQMNLSSSPILKENNRNKGGRRRRVAVVKQNQLPLNWCGFPPILSSSWHFVLTITRKGGKKEFYLKFCTFSERGFLLGISDGDSGLGAARVNSLFESVFFWFTFCDESFSFPLPGDPDRSVRIQEAP